MSITQPHITRRSRKALAGAAATLAIGVVIAGCGSSNTTTATPAAATSSAASSTQGTPPAIGKTVTGAAADKAKAAAVAKYPGTVERVEQLSDGSYVVHVMRSSGGEVHVKVSKAFAVTGIDQGMRGGGGPGGGVGDLGGADGDVLARPRRFAGARDGARHEHLGVHGSLLTRAILTGASSPRRGDGRNAATPGLGGD